MNTAIELLRKGGTLVSQPCSACGGVKVKFSNKITCVNCDKEETIAITETEKKETIAITETEKKETKIDVINELKNIILSKIGELLPVLMSEKDLNRQTSIVELIKHYLEVLTKITKEN